MRSKLFLIEMQISDIEMVNKKNYGTIGYRMKTSYIGLSDIGLTKNLQLLSSTVMYFRNILTLGYLCAHLNYIKKLEVYGGEIILRGKLIKPGV